MGKIDQAFIIQSYRGGIDTYKNATTDVGLWASEKYAIGTYFDKSDRILDVGCGAGRTTLAMDKLGFHTVLGIDLNPAMIEAARALAPTLKFRIGDATDLASQDNRFDAVLFSFNGIMTIPERKNRLQAFREIHRVLRPDGVFIFTTHDREADSKFHDFWQEEVSRWIEREQDPRLFEMGDLVSYSEDVKSEIYIHIPTRGEILNCLEEAGFDLIEDFWRADRFRESESVKNFSGDCRFWIAKKPSTQPA